MGSQNTSWGWVGKNKDMKHADSNHPVQQRPCPQGSEEWTEETGTARTPRDQDAEISNN